MNPHTRQNIAILVSAVLIIPIIFGGLYLQGIFYPDYQFTAADALVMAVVILGFFCILFGFSYWFIGYWQDTKDIGVYGFPRVEESEEVEEEEPEQTPEPQYEEPIHKHHHKHHHQHEVSLEDEGLRQFNDNDDWINLIPGTED